MLGQTEPGGPHGGDGAVAPQPHADGLGEAVHGVGGVHAGAGAAGGAGVVFILLQAGLVQLAGVVGAHRLEHVAQTGAAAVIHSARHHGAAGEDLVGVLGVAAGVDQVVEAGADGNQQVLRLHKDVAGHGDDPYVQQYLESAARAKANVEDEEAHNRELKAQHHDQQAG